MTRWDRPGKWRLQLDARNVNKTAAIVFAILLPDGKTSVAIAIFLRNYKKCK
jgi:hypothetical protein